MENKRHFSPIILTLFAFLCSGHFYAQNKAVDSLLHELKFAKHDTTRARIFLYLSDELFLDNPEMCDEIEGKIREALSTKA